MNDTRKRKQSDSLTDTPIHSPLITGLLSGIAAASKELNKAADRANRYLKAVQDQLVASGAGVDFWLDEPYMERTVYFEPDERSFEEKTLVYLGYAKVGQEWGLATRTEILVADESRTDPEIALLLAEKRERRVNAIRFVPSLLEGLAKELRSRARTINTEVDKAASV